MAKLMSERLKEQLAERMGVAPLVAQQGWGAVPARECGSLVRFAVEMAEERLRQDSALR